MLKMNLAGRDEEIDRIKVMKRLEVERAREEGYDKAEKRMIATIKSKEARFAEEKAELEARVQSAGKEATVKLERAQFMAAFTQWRLVAKLAKVKLQNTEGTGSGLEEILQAINKGNSNQYLEQIRD